MSVQQQKKQSSTSSRAKRKRSDEIPTPPLDHESNNTNTTPNMKDEEGEQAADEQDQDQEDETPPWSEEFHRAFVTAIYDAGLAQSSPSVILENMTSRPASLTSERVKSHLQKYRKSQDKSKEAFLSDYDSFMRKALTVGGLGRGIHNSLVGSGNGSGSSNGGSGSGGASHVVMPPAAMMEMMGDGKPSGGDIAAFLSYSCITEGEAAKSAAAGGGTANSIMSPIGIQKDSQDYLKNFVGTHLPFPQLTEEEKQSPLGVSMVYVMGLFSSLSQHMMNERRSQIVNNTAIGDATSMTVASPTTTFSMPPPTSKAIAAGGDVTSGTANNNENSGAQINGMPVMKGHGHYNTTTGNTQQQQQTTQQVINNENNNANANDGMHEMMQAQAGAGLSQQELIQLQQQQQQQQQNPYWRNSNTINNNNNNNIGSRMNAMPFGGAGMGVNDVHHGALNGNLEGTNWSAMRQIGLAAVIESEPLSQQQQQQQMPQKMQMTNNNSSNGGGGNAARRSSPASKPGSYAQV